MKTSQMKRISIFFPYFFFKFLNQNGENVLGSGVEIGLVELPDFFFFLPYNARL